MKIIRFLYKKQIKWGVVDNRDITVIEGEPYSRIRTSGDKIRLDKVKVLAPATPSKIICTGLNYKDHARELKMRLSKEPVIFIKPATSLTGPDEKIIYPPGVKNLSYEAELAVIIGKKCRNIPEEDAGKYIFGFTCLNDVTARDMQARDGQWTRAKSFDTFCPLGPCAVKNLNHADLNIRSRLNGEQKQDSSTKNLIFSIPFVISFVSRVMTLLPGDIISTGTPPGVGPMKKGDMVEVEIEGIGILRNYVG